MTQQLFKTAILSFNANSSRLGCALNHGTTAIMFLALTAFMAGCKTSDEPAVSQQFDKVTQEKRESAREMKDETPDKDVKADNSRMNEDDRSSSEPTADQAQNNLSDRETMQMIRKSIIADKSLSLYGHNVKVIAQNGHVTLNGTVNTQEERRNIAAKADEVAGRDNVTNKLQVKGL